MEIIKHQASDETKKLLQNISSDYTKLKISFEETLDEVKRGINIRSDVPKTKNILTTKNYGHFNVHVLGDNNSKGILIYLHGGGYLYGLDPLQFEFCDLISTECNLQIYIVDYGLPLKYNWKHAYQLLEHVYEDVLNKNKKIYIFGDSAGGGLSLGFVQYLSKNNINVPDRQVLISPWLDLTMSNPDSKNYEKADPFLGIDGLIKAGKLWADGFDAKDYRLSPIFGDLSCIPETLVTTGTAEVMYPDIMKFSENLSYSGTSVKLIICEDSFHVYPFWKVSEADFAIKQIIEFLD